MGTRRKAKVSEAPPQPAEESNLPERWSAQRKTELVMRLLRGEPLDTVSRESQVPAHELESWKRIFLETGARGLKSRADPEERELTLARAKIGELMMRLELAEASRAPSTPSGSKRRWITRPTSLSYRSPSSRESKPIVSPPATASESWL